MPRLTKEEQELTLARERAKGAHEVLAVVVKLHETGLDTAVIIGAIDGFVRQLNRDADALEVKVTRPRVAKGE